MTIKFSPQGGFISSQCLLHFDSRLKNPKQPNKMFLIYIWKIKFKKKTIQEEPFYCMLNQTIL
jgi:hypothetical protein